MQRPDLERTEHETPMQTTRLTRRRLTVRLLSLLGIGTILTLTVLVARFTEATQADEPGPSLAPPTGPLIPSRAKTQPTAQINPPATPVQGIPTALPVKPLVKGSPLFQGWPKDAQPELAIVLSGQMYGYLQPCGCSRPQLGGLERRYNFIDQLKNERKWSVLPVDLGDIASKKGLNKQSLLKHKVTMESLDKMGYQAIGVGEQDYNLSLLDALAGFTLQRGNVSPFVLAGNMKDRDRDFPGADNKAMVGLLEIVVRKGQPTVGIVGVVGSQTGAQFKGREFESNGVVLRNAINEMAAAKTVPDIRVLLYQGGMKEALLAAEAFPEFNIVLCKTEEEEPPAFPKMVGKDGEPKRMVIGVGHKGRHVGVVGVFKAKDGIALHYQLVSLGEEYETPDAKSADHPILKQLEAYTEELKRDSYLRQYPKGKHPVQVLNPGARFVGSESCKTCHGNEYAIWETSKHAHAYEALSKIATRPSNRQFDGECIVCHTVGFAYEGGFIDLPSTPNLKGVGCESCHGPGSLHVGDPKNVDFYKTLSPWKLNKADHLADVARMMDPNSNQSIDEKRTALRVDDTCQKCHDTDNDPHFRLEDAKYWPMIVHGNGNRPAKPKK